MQVFIGCDHAGIEYKDYIMDYLSAKNINIEDCGINVGEKVDYPLMSQKVADKVLANEQSQSLGILLCGTGVGISIKANRNKGIRAALVYDDFTAEMAKAHNNANILCFGARTMELDDILKRIDIFLATIYEGDTEEGIRHNKRLEMLDS